MRLLCLLLIISLHASTAQTVQVSSVNCAPLLLSASSLDRFERARQLQSGNGCERDLPAAIAIYRALLLLQGDPQIRRAVLELGNLVIDGTYTSGQTRLDLFWARTITQELIGQEQFKLAFTHGSSMDLPESPEVSALTVESAASYDVDLAQRQMASRVPAAEGAAWLRLSGQTFAIFQDMAKAQDQHVTPYFREMVGDEFADLLAIRAADGAFYRRDNVLLDPGMRTLQTRLLNGTDPDAQLRLAYYYELLSGDSAYAHKAMDLYRIVRDGRVSSVRFKIGSDYELGADRFPVDPVRASRWYGFAAQAGSTEACLRIGKLKASDAITADQAAAALTGCPR